MSTSPELEADAAGRSWLAVLRAELSPAPGRFNAAVRITVATLIVLTTSMALQTPSAALSIFIVFYISTQTPGPSTQNSIFVAIAAVAAVAALTLSIGATLLIYRLTIDYPPARLAAMALGFFLGMFVSRVFVMSGLGFVVGFVLLVTQSYVDLFPDAEPLVRAVLWVWVAIVYPAAVAVGVNLILLPADPDPLLRREMAARLAAIRRALALPVGTDEARDAASALANFALQGSAPLLKLLHLAELRDGALKAFHAERAAAIAALDRLIGSAALLADLPPVAAAAERARLDRELERAPASDEAPLAAPAARAFVADALSNPRYAQFALKVTLAAMLCYVAYTALDWPGIHTCMMTCAVVALSSAGATIHRATLRLVGVATGGALALVAIVFVVPHLTSIGALALLVAVIAAPAAWIAMGSQRTAYIGVQIVFTFALAVLENYAPSTDVTEFRDRFVGVALGVLAMALVFAWVWPEHAVAGMARALAEALRCMARLAAGTGDTRTLRAAAWQSLAEADQLAQVSAFEPESLERAGAEQLKTLRRLAYLARRVLLSESALGRVRDAVHIPLSRALPEIAARIESGTAGAADALVLRAAFAGGVAALDPDPA